MTMASICGSWVKDYFNDSSGVEVGWKDTNKRRECLCNLMLICSYFHRNNDLVYTGLIPKELVQIVQVYLKYFCYFNKGVNIKTSRNVRGGYDIFEMVKPNKTIILYNDDSSCFNGAGVDIKMLNMPSRGSVVMEFGLTEDCKNNDVRGGFGGWRYKKNRWCMDCNEFTTIISHAYGKEPPRKLFAYLGSEFFTYEHGIRQGDVIRMKMEDNTMVWTFKNRVIFGWKFDEDVIRAGLFFYMYGWLISTNWTNEDKLKLKVS